MTGFYNKHIMPRLVDISCGASVIGDERGKIVPQAEGVVVEIGVGSGHNLPFYDVQKVKRIIGIDPVREMTALANKRLEETPLDIEIVNASAEDMPMENNMADTVVLTYCACSIPSVDLALSEIRRVLKPAGKLLFCEHGRSPDVNVASWQDRLNPLWNKLAGGCNLNREIAKLIADAGFDITMLETSYLMNFPKFSTYHFRGQANIR